MFKNTKRYIIVSYHMFGDGAHGYWYGDCWGIYEECAALYSMQLTCEMIIREIKNKKFTPCYVVVVIILNE